jgi:hypothetical protein
MRLRGNFDAATKSAINDVQRPFFDIERGFSDGFA